MNDLKTSRGSATGSASGQSQEHDDLAHRRPKRLECKEVPVQAILDKFRALGGIKGRYAHRGAARPTYNFRVNS